MDMRLRLSISGTSVALGLGFATQAFLVFAISIFLYSINGKIGSHVIWSSNIIALFLVIYILINKKISPIFSILSVIIFTAAVLVTPFISAFFYDISWDGIAYHQETIIQLKNGWNPFYTHLSDDIDYLIWSNHYPKFTWIYAANYFSLFDNIESGKTYTVILFLSLFFLSLSLLLTYDKIKVRWALLIACLISFNPIVINQLLNYYLDGTMYILFTLVVVSSIYLIKGKDKIWYYLYVISGIMLMNIKFTGLPYLFIIMSVAIFYEIINGKIKDAAVLSGISAFTVLFGIFCFGFNPYVTNFIDHAHPLYPVYGKGAIDIMSYTTPLPFTHLNRFEKLFLSLFSVVSNEVIEKPILRFPFIINNYGEIASSAAPSGRIAGFGFWFSGILMLSFFSTIYYLLSRPLKSNISFLVIFGGLVLSVIINPEAWWARYVPQLWLLPIIILFSLVLHRSKKESILIYLLSFTMIVNSGVIFVTSIKRNYRASQAIIKNLNCYRINRIR
jgi:hypothetical protein